MNKSYSKIRHIQETNLKLEKRLLSEKQQKGIESLSPDQKKFHDYVSSKFDDGDGLNEVKFGDNSFTQCKGLCATLTPIDDYDSVTWDFGKNQITGTKSFGFDPKPIPLNSTFDVSKKWFDATWK